MVSVKTKIILLFLIDAFVYCGAPYGVSPAVHSTYRSPLCFFQEPITFLNLYFMILWSFIVYYPMAHMVWGQGGLLGDGLLHSVDFAGGNVVHISSV